VPSLQQSDRNRHILASPVRTMQERNPRLSGGIAALGFAALGVVLGDIGTSPLYTLKTVLDLTGDGSPATVLGLLSLIVGRGLHRNGPSQAGTPQRVDIFARDSLTCPFKSLDDIGAGAGEA
jgi:hypothetical protein